MVIIIVCLAFLLSSCTKDKVVLKDQESYRVLVCKDLDTDDEFVLKCKKVKGLKSK